MKPGPKSAHGLPMKVYSARVPLVVVNFFADLSKRKQNASGWIARMTMDHPDFAAYVKRAKRRRS